MITGKDNMTKESGMIYDVEDKPPMKENVIFVLQEFLAIIAATILVPVLVDPDGVYLNQAAALIGAGAGTIVYLLFTKFKSPVFLGSSFAFILPLGTALSCGYFGILFGALIAALVYVVLALIIKAVGTGWMNKYLPPIVLGPTVAMIGFSLAGSAMNNVMGTFDGGPGYNLWWILIGLVTFFAVVIVSVKLKGKIIMFPFVIGIAVGYVLAAIVTLMGDAMGIEMMKVVSMPDWGVIGDFGNWIPDLTFVGLLNQDLGSLDITKVINIAVIYLVTAFVVFAEHIGDHKNLGTIIGRDLINDPGLKRTLPGDGVGSFVGALFGGIPNTTYGESIGCVALSKNASVSTTLYTAIFCIIIAFVYPFVLFLGTIPACVVGGICIALYGFISVSGLRMLSGIDLNEPRNLYVAASIFICGIGALAFHFTTIGGRDIIIDGIAAALIVGVITNLICRKKEETVQ